MRFISSSHTSCQLTASSPLSCYFPSLLPPVFTPSVLPVPQTPSPEWRTRMVAFRKQLLTSLFPHPAPITVIISTVSQDTRRTLPLHPPPPNPTVPPHSGLQGCADRLIQPFPRDRGEQRESERERNGGRKRKLFNTSTGAREMERDTVSAAHCQPSSSQGYIRYGSVEQACYNSLI